MTLDQHGSILFQELAPGAAQINVARLVGYCTMHTDIFDKGIRMRLISERTGPQGANDRIFDDALSQLYRRAGIEIFGDPFN